MKIEGKNYRSVWMEGKAVMMIDQRLLPHKFSIIKLKTVDEVCDAIKTMAVRGAPAIGATGCYGMALAQLTRYPTKKAYKKLLSTRPTAYDLKDGLDYYMKNKGTPNKKADAYADESAERCRRIGAHGAKLIKDGMRILTHCNAGALACVDWGTALAPIRVAHRGGKRITVYVDETRPRLQGARITAWELKEEGIPHKLIADNAAGHLMASEKVDLVLVGADRIALNGDFANKIGTYEKAVLAKENKIPFYVAAPSSTFDMKCPGGRQIPIEERASEEVSCVEGIDGTGQVTKVRITYDHCPTMNPAFDVTPSRYVTGFITEDGIKKPGRRR
ncbi:MAG: S-methyl-5-thioribose-1-phosphate isomerase [Candidatus Altiarchaeota archaeon]